MSAEIRLYNTKSRQIENFKPIIPNEVGIYSCGPTVYHYAHIGNLRAYVFADVLRRLFVSARYTVKHIINITDVDILQVMTIQEKINYKKAHVARENLRGILQIFIQKHL